MPVIRYQEELAPEDVSEEENEMFIEIIEYDSGMLPSTKQDLQDKMRINYLNGEGWKNLDIMSRLYKSDFITPDHMDTA